MDEIDRRILCELQRDGRIDNNALAEKVGLSPSPCLRRVRRLEEAGVIVGYTAVLDKQVLGLGLVVLVDVIMNQTTRPSLEEFERRARKIPAVVSCMRLLGDVDYVLEVVVRDLEEYDHLYTEQIIQLPDIERTNSRVVATVVKETSEVPIPEGESEPRGRSIRRLIEGNNQTTKFHTLGGKPKPGG